jgi:methyltransferase (TIGR00027 family)
MIIPIIKVFYAKACSEFETSTITFVDISTWLDRLRYRVSFHNFSYLLKRQAWIKTAPRRNFAKRYKTLLTPSFPERKEPIMERQSFTLDSAHLLAPPVWEKWRKLRYECAGITKLLQDQVPVLKYVEWRVTKFEPGLVHTILPLIPSATNQHCTHQAALFILGADYTGGLTIGSLLPDFPVAGVHPALPSENSMSLWLVKSEIRYLRPSVGQLEIIAELASSRHEMIRRRFVQGKPVIETIAVYFRNGSTTIAEAEMTYFARRSDMLHSQGEAPDKVNALYLHKLISSAELIAGVRAKENGTLFQDPYAAAIAGEHGRALADRFYEKLPQLGKMVAARTRHLDRQILDYVRRGGRNLVLLGVGYDMRPFRLDLPPGMCIYELDSSWVLSDRKKRLEELGVNDPPGMRRISVPIDLRATPLADALRDQADFTAPHFVAMEGLSMYFEEPAMRALLQGILPVMQNENSLLWTDFASAEGVFHPEIYPEIKKFMEGMQTLGEPFVFGVNDPRGFMEENGFQSREVIPSNVFLGDSRDPVYAHYRFSVASAAQAVLRTPAEDALVPTAVHAAHLLPAPAMAESLRENSHSP